MKVHHAKVLMLLVTAFLTLSLPSLGVAQDRFIVPDSLAKNDQDAAKASNAYANGLGEIDANFLNELVRRLDNEAFATTGSFALKSYSQDKSYTQNEESSNRKQAKIFQNKLAACKNDCAATQVDCLCHTGQIQCQNDAALLNTNDAVHSKVNPSPKLDCFNDFAACLTQCTGGFCTDVNKTPDPTINGEGQDVAMANEFNNALIAVREVKAPQAANAARLGSLLIQENIQNLLIILALDHYKEYGVPEGLQTEIPAGSTALTSCRVKIDQIRSQCYVDSKDSNSSLCNCEIPALLEQLNCNIGLIRRASQFSD